MSQSPTEQTVDGKPSSYLDSWNQLARLIQQGRSFSGHERNCCFLNTRDGRFANISAISSLDFPDDGRSIAVTDWDHDGDLDLWVANRTGPRVRFLRNDIPKENHFLSIDLVGDPRRGVNRDAIGAMVELFLKNQPAGLRNVRTRYAGDGFLSQSSRWIHFGISKSDGDDPRVIDRLEVHWPGSKTVEVFADVPVDRRVRVWQGTGECVVADKRASTPNLVPAPVSTPPRSVKSRLRLSTPLQSTNLRFIDVEDKHEDVFADKSKYVLINLWASWCGPCLQELSELANHKPELEDLGLDVVAINVESLDSKKAFDRESVKPLLSRIGYGFRFGFADDRLIRHLTELTQRPVYRQRNLPLPSSLLFNEEHQLAVVYRGTVSIEQLKTDLQSLSATEDEVLGLCVPFPGRWFIDTFRGDPISIASVFLEGDYLDDAREVLNQHLLREEHDSPSGSSSERSRRDFRLADVYRMRARINLAQKAFANAVSDLRKTLEYRPHFKPAIREYAQALTARGVAFRESGQIQNAVDCYNEAVRVMTNWPPAANNLAWILATSADDSLRDGPRAVELAEFVCRVSGYRQANALDTLAAAYAEVGRFNDAVRTSERATEISRISADVDLTRQIEARNGLYRGRTPHRE